MTMLAYLGISLAFVAFVASFHFWLYPTLVRIMGDKGKESKPQVKLAWRQLPTIELILTVHDAAPLIAEQIRTITRLDYPCQLFKLTVIGDGCSDDTVARARMVAAEPQYAHMAIKVIDYQGHRGKVTSAYQAMALTQADIIILLDVGMEIGQDDLRLAARQYLQADGCGPLQSFFHQKRTYVETTQYWDCPEQLEQIERHRHKLIEGDVALFLFRQ